VRFRTDTGAPLGSLEVERSTPLRAVAPALKACLSNRSSVQVQVRSPHGETVYDEDGAYP